MREEGWPAMYVKAVRLAAARWNVSELPGVDREDLEQVAAQRLSETRPTDPGMAYTMAYRALVDWVRVHGPRSQHGSLRPRSVQLPEVGESTPEDVAAFTVPSHEDDVAERMLLVRRLAWLREHLPRLPRRQRQVMTHYTEGVSQADSAILLGMAEGTVGAHRSQGKATLRRWAKERRDLGDNGD